ncbi:STAS-like domain-containing protein [Solidesulfovibrio sp.]
MPRTISIKESFGTNISSKQLAEQVLTAIHKLLPEYPITIDFKNVTGLTTYCASLIFGTLYDELGGDLFYQKIIITNATSSIKIVIHEGIVGYLEKKPISE